MGKLIRIAKVTATGQKYLVNYLSGLGTPGAKVHCWGEVLTVKGNLGTVHDTSKTFLKSAVEITEEERTPALLRSLFNQMVANKRAAGHQMSVSRTGRTVRDHGTKEQQEKRAAAIAAAPKPSAAERDLMNFISQGIRDIHTGLSWTKPSRTRYTEPAVEDGGHKALPETREEVINGILEQLTAPGAKPAIRQDFSNGEFTASSLIVGTTFAAVADRKLDLEVPGHVAYFDTNLNLWWRTGGSFD